MKTELDKLIRQSMLQAILKLSTGYEGGGWDIEDITEKHDTLGHPYTEVTLSNKWPLKGYASRDTGEKYQPLPLPTTLTRVRITIGTDEDIHHEN